MPEKGQLLSPTETEEKIRRYEEEERFRVERVRFEAAERDARLRGIPLGHRFGSVTPKDWEGGLLWGKPGRGKTHEAICRLLSTPRGVFVTALELLDLARDEEMDRIDEFGERRLRRIWRAEHLVLDDIGVHRPTPFAIETLYRLVDDRWNGDAETLLTSNLDPRSDLASCLDARCLSRILAFGPVVEVTGKDRRWDAASPEERSSNGL